MPTVLYVSVSRIIIIVNNKINYKQFSNFANSVCDRVPTCPSPAQCACKGVHYALFIVWDLQLSLVQKINNKEIK